MSDEVDDIDKMYSDEFHSIFKRLSDAMIEDVSDSIVKELNFFKNRIYFSIKTDLISSLAGEVLSDPFNVEYRRIRREILDDNYAEIVSHLNSEMIEASVAKFLAGLIDVNFYGFEGVIKNSISSFILNNFDKFENDPCLVGVFNRVVNPYKNEIKRLESIIEKAEQRGEIDDGKPKQDTE